MNYLIKLLAGTTNIAAKGTAAQTDTYYETERYGRPEKAIDGNKDGNWKYNDHNSISLTVSMGAE